MKKRTKNISKFLILLLILITTQIVLAYEAVILQYPNNKGWHKINYAVGQNEIIVQYAPSGQEVDNCTETVVYHSYKAKKGVKGTAFNLLRKQLTRLTEENKTIKITTLKNKSEDALVYWCDATQCEIVRAVKTHEGIVTIHYINKDYKDFHAKKNEWLTRISKAKTYYSYYRTDYVLNKRTFFEL